MVAFRKKAKKKETIEIDGNDLNAYVVLVSYWMTTLASNGVKISEFNVPLRFCPNSVQVCV